MKQYMKKEDCLNLFKIEMAVCDIPMDDKIMLREEWNIYTDSLCKDGLISESQYNNWSNPF